MILGAALAGGVLLSLALPHSGFAEPQDTAAQTASVATTPVRPGIHHARIPAPKGASQVGWVIAIALCAAVDLTSRRRNWDLNLWEISKSGGRFVAQAWRRLPGPFALNFVCWTAVNLLDSTSTWMALVGLLAVVPMAWSLWSAFGGCYRIALADRGVAPPSRWGFKIGGPEVRSLGAGFAFLVAFLILYLVLLIGADAAAGLLNHGHIVQTGAPVWLPTQARDPRYVHFIVFGVASTIAGAALATLWAPLIAGGDWHVGRALQEARGAWAPISILSTVPALILFGVQLVGEAAKANAGLQLGYLHSALLVAAAAMTPLAQTAFIPFSIGVNVRLYRQLVPVAPSSDPLAVFD